MKTVFAFLLGLYSLSTSAFSLFEDHPTSQERETQNSGYLAFPGFSGLKIVSDSNEMIDPFFVAKIQDQTLRDKIESGYFTALELHDFSLRPELASLSAEGTLHFPFMISLFRNLEPMSKNPEMPNFERGDLDVSGEILVSQDQLQVQIVVYSYSEYNLQNRLSRWFGYNKGIDLDFVQQIVVPEVKDWINADPNRVAALLALAAQAARH